nr:hypothetical protein [Tanacetum cinerariifolium]
MIPSRNPDVITTDELTASCANRRSPLLLRSSAGDSSDTHHFDRSMPCGVKVVYECQWPSGWCSRPDHKRFELEAIDQDHGEFSSSSWRKKLYEETSGEIIPSRDGSRGTIKVNGIYNFEKVLKMLDQVFRHKSLECTSVLHQPDGVRSQRGHLGSFEKDAVKNLKNPRQATRGVLVGTKAEIYYKIVMDQQVVSEPSSVQRVHRFRGFIGLEIGVVQVGLFSGQMPEMPLEPSRKLSGQLSSAGERVGFN